MDPKDSVSKKQKLLIFAFILAVAGTVFDAISSWQIIELNPIAVEANPIWGSLAGGLGFGGAMALRALVGTLLLTVLLLVALRSKKPSLRKLAGFGIYLSAAVLLGLSIYHLVFRALYG